MHFCSGAPMHFYSGVDTQTRLCARYRRLQNTGKPQNVIVVAIARELAAFVWSIARMAQPPILAP
jgi:transposase